MANTCRWGIIGPGRIARKFAKALQLVQGASLHAVASRDLQRAKEFADEFGAAVAYDDYEKLANDPDVDAVYIATPHTFHHAHAVLCLQRKKAVLCEKPMSVSSASTLEMIATAKNNGAFLMEAMWSRFLPIIKKSKELIDAGVIGEIKSLTADFGFAAPLDPGSRLYDLQLGGGSILDVGVYPLFFALFLLGYPDEIKSFSHLANTGADETTSAILYYKKGMVANIVSSISAQTPITAEISGTKGRLVLERPWYKGSVIQCIDQEKVTQEFSLPYGDNGFEFQIQEVQQCLERGLTESEAMPLDFSLQLSKIMEQICVAGGIRYPVQPA